jgi:hypothetical protein
MIQSSKSFGLVPASCCDSTWASARPTSAATWSSLGSFAMLFWNGYGTKRFLIHTWDTRCRVFQFSGPLPNASSIRSSKYLQAQLGRGPR